MNTLQDALLHGIAKGLDRLDVQMLLLHALGHSPHDRAWLIAHDSDALPPEVSTRWLALVQRRQAGEPVAYLLGEKEFAGLTLWVDARVLVPRPDTELLLVRDISFTETAALAKEAEEALMYRDMQSDIVQQVMRRLVAVSAL